MSSDVKLKENNNRAFLFRFVKEMNKQATLLQLKETTFSNPHGLSDKVSLILQLFLTLM